MDEKVQVKDNTHLSALFTYGTLQPGQSNHNQVSDIAGVWEECCVEGLFYPSGQQGRFPYPGLLISPRFLLHPTADYQALFESQLSLNKQLQRVKGSILMSANLPDYWKRLDYFEGNEYTRTLIHVKMEGNKNIPTSSAYCYLVNNRYFCGGDE